MSNGQDDTSKGTGLLEAVTMENFGPDFAKLAMDQYKLYVEMADRISARRLTTMSFFIPSNTAFVYASAILIKEGILSNAKQWALAPFVAAITMCIAWWLIILSYKRLNASKYAVIIDMERLLPLAPYAAEWRMLGKGQSRRGYVPITTIELLVPWIFCGIYVALAATFLV